MLHTMYGRAIGYNCIFFVEYFVLDLILNDAKDAVIGVLAYCIADGSIHRIKCK